MKSADWEEIFCFTTSERALGANISQKVGILLVKYVSACWLASCSHPPLTAPDCDCLARGAGHVISGLLGALAAQMFFVFVVWHTPCLENTWQQLLGGVFALRVILWKGFWCWHFSLHNDFNNAFSLVNDRTSTCVRTVFRTISLSARAMYWSVTCGFTRAAPVTLH